MEKVVILFVVCSLINVILSTLKTLIMVNAGRGSAIIINAVCYGFYTLVVKQLNAVDYVTAVVVTIIANIVGVWISYKIMDLFKKDKLWLIKITIPYKNFENVKTKLKEYSISNSYYNIDKYYVFDCYCETQNDSQKVLELCKQNKGKNFGIQNCL